MTDLPMVIILLKLLRYQTQQMSERLANLIGQVEEVESDVAGGLPTTNFDVLIRKLHSCNTDLIKLDRRWHFENQLALSIRDLIDVHK